MISFGIAVCQYVLSADFGLSAARFRTRHMIAVSALNEFTEFGKDMILP